MNNKIKLNGKEIDLPNDFLKFVFFQFITSEDGSNYARYDYNSEYGESKDDFWNINNDDATLDAINYLINNSADFKLIYYSWKRSIDNEIERLTKLKNYKLPVE